MHGGWIRPLDGLVGLRTPAGPTGDGGIGARRVRNAPSRHRGGGHGNGKDPRLFAAGDLQRSARGDFDGYQVAPGTALPERYSFFAEAFRAQLESRGDEGALKFLVHFEIEPDDGPGAAEGYGRAGRVPADQAMVQADGDRRPRGADLSARRFSFVDAPGRPARYL